MRERAQPAGEGERRERVNVKCSGEQGEDAEWQHLGIDCDIVLTFLMDVCNKVTCKWSTRGDMTLYLEKDKTASEYWAIIAVCKPWINSVSGCIIGYSIPSLVHSSKPGTEGPVANLSECRACARPEPLAGASPFPVGCLPPRLPLARPQWPFCCPGLAAAPLLCTTAHSYTNRGKWQKGLSVAFLSPRS